MQITSNTTGMQVGLTVATDKDAHNHCVVAVKGTFQTNARGEMTLAPEQRPLVSTDEHYGDPASTSVLYECDLQMLERQQQRGPKNPLSDRKRRALARDKKKRYQALIAKAKARPGCTCTKKTRVLPEPPCDVFYGRPPPESARREAQQDAIEDAWDAYRTTYQKKVGILSSKRVRRELTFKLGRSPSSEEVKTERQVNHLTPKSAGGCPTGDRTKFDNTNLQAHGQLCPACRDIDAAFNEFQT
jgi:hypothetical protein